MDDHTVKIKLKDAFAPYMVSWQKTSIIPKHILADVPDINTASFNTAPVGTGPFKFKPTASPAARSNSSPTPNIMAAPRN